ncbi:MAG TPA: hypothetical protein HA349_09235 [Methanotrichaceae archaeon]|nr:hypothetical protein [Methanotrichaceae archaeon]
MSARLTIIAAIVCEVIGTSNLKLSNGFTKVFPSALVVVFKGPTSLERAFCLICIISWGGGASPVRKHPINQIHRKSSISIGIGFDRHVIIPPFSGQANRSSVLKKSKANRFRLHIRANYQSS